MADTKSAPVAEKTGANKLRIALIYGGVSGEHAISCVTAGAVMAALDPLRYEVVSIGIRRDGTWVLGESDPEKLRIGADGTLPEVTGDGERVVIPPGNGAQSLLAIAEDNASGAPKVRSLGRVDVVFPLLHGPFGEDGTIQGLLEMANIPYVGCGVLASAVGMDKSFMKIVLASAGIAVAPAITVTLAQWQRDAQAVREWVRAAELQYPLYVKPARAGSSLGITKVTNPADLAVAIETAQRTDPKVLIEQGVRGREVECGVLGGRNGEPARASLPGEVVLDVPDDEFYDFEHKYLDTAALTNQVPADLPADVIECVRHTALAAFEACGCEGLTRVDCFVTDRGEVIVNEINTMPGFTPFSMYPALWEQAGWKYSELVDELIALARERGTGLH